MNFKLEHYPLQFLQPAGTSRGVMHIKNSWFVTYTENGVSGKGEISIIEGLTKEWHNKETFEDTILDFITELSEKISSINRPIKWDELTRLIPELTDYPSILFGLEVALLDWQNGGTAKFFDNAFTQQMRKIPINGLIWMGDEANMLHQIEEKLLTGFTTLKMKVGAIDFEKEISILNSIRSRYRSSEITLRVDANGAFNSTNVHDRLNKLAELDIHSIEQPVAPGQIELMTSLCEANIISIALDEELIGIHSKAEKIRLLEQIRPQYIILKPSLHGGILGTKEWIAIAEERKIKWWMTSALESNVGLNAICQLAGEYSNQLPQGLGTGSLYENNVPSSLTVKDGHIFISEN